MADVGNPLGFSYNDSVILPLRDHLAIVIFEIFGGKGKNATI